MPFLGKPRIELKYHRYDVPTIYLSGFSRKYVEIHSLVELQELQNKNKIVK
jgi:hypothetical protein